MPLDVAGRYAANGSIFGNNMNDSVNDTGKRCPFCNANVDPLRAAAVSIVDGKITHFCSTTCRELFLKRSGSAEEGSTSSVPVTGGKAVPSDVKATAVDSSISAGAGKHFDEGRLTDTPFANIEPQQLTRRTTSQFVYWNVFRPWLVELGGILFFSVLLVIVHTHYNFAWASRGVVGAGILFSLGMGIYREFKNGFAAIANAAATPFAAVAVAVSSMICSDPLWQQLAALGLPGVRAIGRCLEFISRRYSGVLQVAAGKSMSWGSREWRDNSPMAVRIRKVAMVMDWARIPLSFGIGGSLYLLGIVPLSECLLGSAILLLVLEPRLLRMVTGDAHLKVALLVGKMGGNIRDANAVDSLSKARTLLFLSSETLTRKDVTVVDFKFCDNVHEAHVLSALYAVESSLHDDRYSRAILRYCSEHGVKQIEKAAAERIDGVGVRGNTLFGTLLCGSRLYMLDAGISTAVVEEAAHELEQSGRRVMYVALDGQLSAFFAVDEMLREGVQSSIQQLLMLGVEPVMMTSAEVDAAQALGSRIGIERVQFGSGKSHLEDVIGRLQKSGELVALLGAGDEFEQNVDMADCAIAIGDVVKKTSMAGIDLRGKRLATIASLFEAALAARRSVVTNLLSSILLFCLGICFAVGWRTPAMVFGVAAAVAAMSFFSTISGPYSTLQRGQQELKKRVSRGLQMVGLARKK